MSKEVHPAEVMGFLNSLFTLLDELIDQYEVYKVRGAPHTAAHSLHLRHHLGQG